MDPFVAATSLDPYPQYAQLVAEQPFGRQGGLWIASSAAAVTEALESGALRVRPPSEPVPRALAGTAIGGMFARMARMNDGAAHRMVKPSIVAALAGIPAYQVARDCARELRGSLPGHFVFQLPACTVARLLGFELTDPALLARDLSRCIAGSPSPDEIARGSAAYELIARQVLASRAGLVAAWRESGIGAEALAANASALFFQVHHATAGLVGNTLLALARHPYSGELRLAVLEALRWDSPVQSTRRFAAEDAVIHGQEVRKGDALVILLAAANRDPLANQRPHEFDPGRSAARIFSFGAGSHACPGQSLAVDIATAGVEALLASGIVPGSLAGSFSYLPASNLRVPLFGGSSRYQ